MKKLFAAFLLAVYLFNIGGQLVLHQYFSYLSDRYFNEQTNKGRYNVNDLTEIRIPINTPNVTDWPAYESVTGQIQFQNTNYNFVKMRMTRHVMYLMCVPNYNTTHLSAQNIIGAKNIKDLPIPKKDHVPYGKTTLLSQLSITFNHFEFNAPYKNVITKVVQPVQQLFSHFPAIPEQPPRPVC